MDRKLLKEHSRCAGSAFLQSRYAICSPQGEVTRGRQQDRPLAVSVEPFICQLQAGLSFTVVPRKVGSAWDRKWSSEPYRVALEFQDAGSPAAWAAQSHGCAVLNHSAEAQQSVLGSADALCQLLSECGEQLCSQVQLQSLGGGSAQAALLPSEGTVQLLVCLKASAPECSRRVGAKWFYHGGHLSLSGYVFQVPMGTLLQQAERLHHTGGLALLQEIRKALDRGNEKFDNDAAREVWRVKPSAELLTTLAGLDDILPKLLLQGLMWSPFAEVPLATPALQALCTVFAHHHFPKFGSLQVSSV